MQTSGKVLGKVHQLEKHHLLCQPTIRRLEKEDVVVVEIYVVWVVWLVVRGWWLVVFLKCCVGHGIWNMLFQIDSLLFVKRPLFFSRRQRLVHVLFFNLSRIKTVKM